MMGFTAMISCWHHINTPFLFTSTPAATVAALTAMYMLCSDKHAFPLFCLRHLHGLSKYFLLMHMFFLNCFEKKKLSKVFH